VRVNDLIAALAIALLAGFVLVHIQSFPPMPGQKYGPAVYPGLIAGGLLVCALLLAVRGARTLRHEGLVHFEGWWREPRVVFGFALVIAVLVVYAWVSERIGFIPVAFVSLAALMVNFRVRPVVALALAAAGTLIVHTIFYKGLRVPLPWGWLKAWAW
jgi:putative tricarboxylic transport membrane protein